MLHFDSLLLVQEGKKSSCDLDSKCTFTIFSSHPSYDLRKYRSHKGVDVKKAVTSPLLHADMREAEHEEEALFLLQFRGAVHLLSGERGS